jgi:hypothetical protein
MTEPPTTEHEEAGRWLRSLSLDARIERIDAVLAELARSNSPLRRALETALPAATGFHPKNLGRGLALAFDSWHRAGIRPLVDRELGGTPDPERTPRSTAVIAAGAIPMPTIEAMLAPLVLGSPVSIRPAQRDQATARILVEGVSALDEMLGRCLSISEFERGDDEALAAFLAVDAVVASGSDPSIAAIRQRLTPGTRFAGYGHRLSVAIVEEPPTAEALASLALDMTLWDQLGCLSPRAVFALGDADAWAEGLAAELASQRGAPRGEVPLEAAAAFQHERASAEMRLAAGADMTLRAGAHWVVVRETDARWRPSPLHRFIRIHPVAGRGELAAALEPVREHLSTVGSCPGLADAAASFAPRSAPLGTMQAPVLAWNHDGIGTLRPLMAKSPHGD